MNICAKLDFPLIWMIFFSLMAFLLGKFIPIVSFAPFLVEWTWIFPFCIGLGFIIWAQYEFKRHKTSIIPRQNPRQLITSGPFKISRNPIYMGFAMIILAMVLKTGAASSLLALIGFVWVIQKRFINDEEAKIRDQFGQEAQNWFAATRRW